jgi:hypothetical protein
MPERPGEVGPEPLPSEDQILSALRSAGWLLEQETQSALMDVGFDTVAGWAFTDPDESISREIDVWGVKHLFSDNNLNFTIRSYVLAECKQSKQPYVLVGRAPDPRWADSRMEHHLRFDTVQHNKGERQPEGWESRNTPGARYLGLEQLPHSPYADTFEATQMTRLDRDGKSFTASNSGIFTSLVYPLAKAITYQRRTFDNFSNLATHDTTRHVAIHFYFPIVVTSAPLFVVNVDDEGYTPKRANWATMARSIRSKTVEGRFRIEVVNQDHLAEYLKSRVLGFSEAVAALAARDPRRFVTERDDVFDPRTGRVI